MIKSFSSSLPVPVDGFALTLCFRVALFAVLDISIKLQRNSVLCYHLMPTIT